jgi:hypothetical protein
MRSTRTMAAVALAAVLLGGCSGGGPTQAPDTGSNGGVTATDVPVATDVPPATQSSGGGAGGTKPAGWDQYGSVHVEFGGPVDKTADYGFMPAGSVFGGAQGSALSFALTDINEIVSVVIGADGTVLVSYLGTDFQMPAASCTTSNWDVGATNASGSFECTAEITILASGAAVPGGTVKGTFEAHA